MKNLFIMVLLMFLVGCVSYKREHQLVCTKNGKTTFESEWVDYVYEREKLNVYIIGASTYTPNVGELCTKYYREVEEKEVDNQ